MKKAWVWVVAALVGQLAAGGDAMAVPTSCDIVSGASCSHNEGCDCDHDGYVRESGKAWKYCHWTKCPIDANDSDASVLGKVSTYNADGDAWTTAYDCDDHDACVPKDCTNICGPAPVDDDGDGSPVGVDCDDTNPYIKPGAPLACCSCDILTVPAQTQAYGCTANPCPLGNPPPVDTTPVDTTPSDTYSPPADTWTGTPDASATSTDTGVVGDDALAWADGATTPRYVTPPSDPGLVGSGTVVHHEPPAPIGCAGGGAELPAGLLAAGLLAAAAWVARRRRAARLAVAVAVLGALGGAGCATVQPWERGRLAKAPMVYGADGFSEGLEQHFFQYREGAAGGFGGGGGGCGCN